eukprot:TRINITY_DN10483_c0_g1_i1.p2 TRINITY_DN10483_c0_g1~~TRINITY_DN10483_c0_g1_i1.p2  ORF type:complete len:409 (-),score=133.96 TRINITY_DN10483_c0_g1_i1:777-1970(-)
MFGGVPVVNRQAYETDVPPVGLLWKRWLTWFAPAHKRLMKKVPSRPDRYGKLADQSRIRRKYLIDTVFYVAFVTIFLVVQLANRDNTHSYMMGQQIQEKLVFQNLKVQLPLVPPDAAYVEKTFADAELVEDWWSFLFGIFYQNAFQPQWYNGKNFTDSNKLRGGWPLYELKIVGAIRFRQVRVKRLNCALAPKLKGFVHFCYPPYSSGMETREDFVLENPRSGPDANESSTWTLEWQSESMLQGGFHWGRVTTYPGSGYVIDLPSDNETLALETFTNMWDSLYIDDQTRVVFIDMMFYNANTDLHSWVRLTSEFPAVGGVLTTYDIRTHHVHRYQDAADFTILTLELIFVMMLLYYMVVEVVEIVREGRGYLADAWNWLDWLNYLCFVAAIIFRIRN